jgi:Flp pilus assembly protein TadG
MTSFAARDEGSAVVDFALVGSLLTLLFGAVLQLGIALYVHNMLVSCAGEGARYAARADRGPADAVAAAKERIAETLTASYAEDVSADAEMVDGVRTVVVRVRAPVPLFGFFGPARAMQATGHAFAERQ